jgi:DHA1 family tetracycline resistance protein-like MFS transporter
LRKRSLLALFLIIFVDLLGFGIVIPLVPFYARQFSSSGAVIGATVAVYSLMQFLFSPVWGRISDRIGRRPVLLISLFGSVIGYVLFAFAHNLSWLIVARVIDGVSGANIGTAQAYITDVTTPENRARGMGLIGAAFGLGFILGPPMGGMLASWGAAHGHAQNFLPGVVACGFSFTAFVLAFLFLGESKPPHLKEPSRRPPQFDPAIWQFVRTHPTLPYILLSLFLIILAFAGMETSVTLHGRERFALTARELGYFFGFMGIVVAVIQGGLIGPLTRRLGERNVIALGAGSLFLGLLLVPSVFRVALLYPAAMLIAMGQGFCYPALTSLVSKAAPPREHGSILGISSSVTSLSRMLGPLITGALYDVAGVAGAFYAAALFVFGALAIVTTRRLQQNGVRQ